MVWIQHHYKLALSQYKEIERTVLTMTSLLNNRDKLEAADNTTSEPDPTNMVDEDKMVFGRFINP